MEEELEEAAKTYGEPVVSLNTVNVGSMHEVRLVLESMIEHIQDKCASDTIGEIEGICVGLPGVDKILRGLRPGGLYVVGGRPGMGKTDFVMQLAADAAANQKRRVAVFSPRFSAKELTERLLANVGRINWQRMESGSLTDDEWSRISFALGKLVDAPIVFSDSPRMTPLQICVEAEQLAKDRGLDLIVVDSFQMLSVDTGNQSLATGLSLAIRDLKALARELNVPIVVTSFLNRAVDLRPNKRPVLSDLRDTGALEDTADAVIFLYRDEIYYPDSPSRGETEIIVAGNAKGALGTAHVDYLAGYGTFFSRKNGA